MQFKIPYLQRQAVGILPENGFQNLRFLLPSGIDHPVILTQLPVQKLRQDAKACGLSKTAYLRRLIEGAELKARPSQELRQLRTEIHHIGNNVNQLARKFNAGFGNKSDAQQARYLMEQIYDLLYEIAKE